MVHHVRHALFIWLVIILVMRVNSSWYETMLHICGDSVSDLFYYEDNGEVGQKCRDMRAAFECIQLQTNHSDWEYMVETKQVDNITVKIDRICQRESSRLCAIYLVKEKMQQCYGDAELPQIKWNCEKIKEYITELLPSIACMKKAVRSCPDDAFIADDLRGLDEWADQAITCNSSLPSGTIRCDRPSRTVFMIPAALTLLSMSIKGNT